MVSPLGVAASRQLTPGVGLFGGGAALKKLAAVLIAWGPLGVFALAALDSAGVPLPASVDTLIVVSAAAGAAPALVAAAAICGSLIGNVILFSLARKGGRIYLERRATTPRARKFIAWFQTYGMLTVFIPAIVPFVPLPLKIFVLSAGAFGLRLRVFVAIIFVARLLRFGGLAWLGYKLGTESVGWLAARKWHLLAFAILLFMIFAALVKWKERRARVLRVTPESAG